MQWHDPNNQRAAPPLMVDKMAASRDPLNPYPMLDIYAPRLTRGPQVLASTQDPPQIKPVPPAKKNGWGFGRV